MKFNFDQKQKVRLIMKIQHFTNPINLPKIYCTKMLKKVIVQTNQWGLRKVVKVWTSVGKNCYDWLKNGKNSWEYFPGERQRYYTQNYDNISRTNFKCMKYIFSGKTIYYGDLKWKYESFHKWVTIRWSGILKYFFPLFRKWVLFGTNAIGLGIYN